MHRAPRCVSPALLKRDLEWPFRNPQIFVVDGCFRKSQIGWLVVLDAELEIGIRHINRRAIGKSHVRGSRLTKKLSDYTQESWQLIKNQHKEVLTGLLLNYLVHKIVLSMTAT
jgi:hypothetical protein